MPHVECVPRIRIFRSPTCEKKDRGRLGAPWGVFGEGRSGPPCVTSGWAPRWAWDLSWRRTGPSVLSMCTPWAGSSLSTPSPPLHWEEQVSPMALAGWPFHPKTKKPRHQTKNTKKKHRHAIMQQTCPPATYPDRTAGLQIAIPLPRTCPAAKVDLQPDALPTALKLPLFHVSSPSFSEPETVTACRLSGSKWQSISPDDPKMKP